jgi:hypothetical protein
LQQNLVKMELEKETVVYKPKGQKVYVLSANCEIIGVWTNLKQMCIDRALIEKFPSYSKLSKDVATLRNESDDLPVLEIKTKDGKAYQIKTEKLK